MPYSNIAVGHMYKQGNARIAAAAAVKCASPGLHQTAAPPLQTLLEVLPYAMYKHNTLPQTLLQVPNPCHLKPATQSHHRCCQCRTHAIFNHSTLPPTLLQALHACCLTAPVQWRQLCCKCCTHAVDCKCCTNAVDKQQYIAADTAASAARMLRVTMCNKQYPATD